MHGIYAAETGFSLEFFPESVIVGCGPDVARAYPYTVEAGASGATERIAAPDKPLVLVFRNGGLEPGGGGAYLVHGRITTGQDDDGNFTFSPTEQSCGLAALMPSATIPAGGGSAVPSAGGVSSRPTGGAMATPGSPTVQADSASAARADAQGKGTMPGVPAGTYYLMISTRYNNQAVVWDEAELKAGNNSVALDMRNGRVVN